MATTQQSLESIANNVTGIAREVTALIENSGSPSMSEAQIRGIVNSMLPDNSFDYTRFIKRKYYGNLANPLTGLPILYLSGDMTGISHDNKVDMTFRYGDTVNGYTAHTCTLKIQGNSSVNFRKKNYTLGKVTPKLGVGWGEQKKYVIKSNFIDHTYARNVVSAKLWGDVVKSRTGTDFTTTKLKAAPNGGAVDGFPVIAVINNEYRGIYTFNIPKDDWMMGMGDSETEGFLCCEKSTSTAKNLKGTLTVEDVANEIGFSIGYVPDEDNYEWIVNSFNTMVTTAINSTGVNYRNTLAQYANIDAFIDYYIYSCLVGNPDGVTNNYNIGTYDGVQWFISAYDLDMTFGWTFQATNINSPTAANGGPTFASFNNVNRVMHLIYTYDKEALKSRYEVLRNGVLSESAVALRFENYAINIPEVLAFEDAKYWNDMPATYLNDVSQITNWYRLRCEYMDKEVESWNV